MHNVLPALEPLLVEISTLNVDPENARKHDARNLGAIATSLRRFQQRTPIVVRESTREIEKGNGTLQAAIQEGWTHIAAVFVDDDADTMRAYAITDNKTSDISVWDYKILAEQLDDLEDYDVDMADLGWTESELEVLGAAEWTPPDITDEDFGDGSEAGVGGDAAEAEGAGADGLVPVVFRLTPQDAKRVEAASRGVCLEYGVTDAAAALADLFESASV